MSKITLDPELKNKLNGLSEQIEVCDADGRTLGHFLPASLYQKLLYAWAKAEFSDDRERDEARKEVKDQHGLTTAEAIAYLRQIVERRTGA